LEMLNNTLPNVGVEAFATYCITIIGLAVHRPPLAVPTP